MKASSAYIHVPFCHHRCGYCNFTLIAGRSDLYDRFLSALERELSSLGTPQPVRTIFIGGGTPSALPSEMFERLVSIVKHWLPISSDGEFSVEANPADIDRRFCELLRDSGVNRISIGGQSYSDEKLRALDRSHTGKQLKEAVALAHDYLPMVSVDLIFGAPGESLDVWFQDLEEASLAPVQHVSTYGLTWEKGTKFWTLRERGQLMQSPEELELQMYRAARERLVSAGFEHYEISNFAKPNHRCRHNEVYWSGDPYLAFGPGAARFVDGTRSVNHRSTTRYLQLNEQGKSPVDESETLSLDQMAREHFIFGMRRLEGVDRTTMEQRFSDNVCAPIFQKALEYLEGGWFEVRGTQWRLSEQGLYLSDSIWPDFI